MSLANRVGSLLELYSIQLLLKNPQIEVHNKKKIFTYILCSLYSLWRWFVDDMLLIYISDMYSHITNYKWKQWVMIKCWMLTKYFLCRREVLGKRSPQSFTPPSKCGRCVQQLCFLKMWHTLLLGMLFLICCIFLQTCVPQHAPNTNMWLILNAPSAALPPAHETSFLIMSHFIILCTLSC